MSELISKNTTIGEAVAKYPQVAEVFTRYGLHCVGCHVSYDETVEQGASGHGMDAETISKMVEEANVIAQKPSNMTQSTPKKEGSGNILLSAVAVTKIKALMKKQGITDGYFRIGVVAGGCSGFTYHFDFDTKKNPEDVVLDKKGLRVLIDHQTLEMLDGSKIDYLETLHGAGFKVENPKAQKTCGCGTSFS